MRARSRVIELIGTRPRAVLERALEESSVDLLSYLKRRVGAQDAPDLLGETFVIAWRRVNDVPPDSERARMWLFGVARGVLLNHRRGERRRWALSDRIRGHSIESTAPAADENLEIRDAIARLGPDLEEIVTLVHWERLTIAEAAEVVRIPASTARGRYQRAKGELRIALGVSTASAT